MRESESLTQLHPESNEFFRPLRIGVDIDSTIFNINPWLRKIIKKGLHFDIFQVQKFTYNLERWPEILARPNGEKFIKLLFAHPYIYENAKPLPGAIETLNLWRSQGHEMWFPTARPQHLLKKTTLNSFSLHGLGWATDRIIFADSFASNRSDFKKRVVQEFGLQVLIDDHAETLKNVCSVSLESKIGLRWPWNKDEDVGDALLVDNWEQIAEIVSKIANNPLD